MKSSICELQDDVFLMGDLDAVGVDQTRSLKQYIKDEFDYLSLIHI